MGKYALNHVTQLLPFTEKLLRFLRVNGGLSRSAISELMEVPRTTVYDNLMFLLRAGLVTKKRFKLPGRARGRPMIIWCPVDKYRSEFH